MGLHRPSHNMNRFLVLSSLLAVCLADGPGGHHGHHGAHHGHHVAGHGAVHGSHQVNHHGVASVQSSAQVHHGTGSSHQAVHQVHSNVHHAPAVHHSPVVHHAPVVHHQPAAPVAVKTAPATQTIADLVVASPQFSTLLAAVKAAGLVDTLASAGPFTVFAPTNAA